MQYYYHGLDAVATRLYECSGLIVLRHVASQDYSSKNLTIQTPKSSSLWYDLNIFEGRNIVVFPREESSSQLRPEMSRFFIIYDFFDDLSHINCDSKRSIVAFLMVLTRILPYRLYRGARNIP